LAEETRIRLKSPDKPLPPSQQSAKAASLQAWRVPPERLHHERESSPRAASSGLTSAH
jgi:hypothetical protein